MSIVTDALNRLQSARAHVVRPTSVRDHNPPKSKKPKPLEKPKEQAYDTRFLTVSIGGFLVISSMAIGAYWWGESLVSEVPMLPSSASSRAVVSSDPIVDEDLDMLATNQDAVRTTQANIESSPGEQSAISPTVEGQAVSTSSQVSEEKAEELIGDTPNNATAEPVLEKASPVQEFSSLPVEQESMSGLTNGEEAKEHASTRVSDAQEVAKTETVVSTSSDPADKDVSSQARSSTLENAEELSRSDFSLGISTAANSEGQQIVSLPFEAEEGLALEKERDVRKVASLSTKQEPTPRVANREEKLTTLSESQSDISHPQSPPSLPPVVANTSHSSNRTSQPLVQNPSQQVEAIVSPAQSGLSPEQRLVKVQLLIEQQSHAEAIDVLNPLFVTPPEKWEPWFWMGTAQFGLGELDKAEDAFMEGLVRDDTVPFLWVQRAVIEQQRGHYGQAMDALRQAQLLDPQLPEVQLNLAYNLEHQGNLKLAQRHYRQYLSLTEGKSTYHAVRRKVLERVLRMRRP